MCSTVSTVAICSSVASVALSLTIRIFKRFWLYVATLATLLHLGILHVVEWQKRGVATFATLATLRHLAAAQL